MTIVAIWLLDRAGRRPLLLSGTAGTAAGTLTVAVTSRPEAAVVRSLAFTAPGRPAGRVPSGGAGFIDAGEVACYLPSAMTKAGLANPGGRPLRQR